MRNLPSKERFIAWLERQPATRVIAQGWGMWDCPLCVFLKSEGWDQPCLMGRDAGFLVYEYQNDEPKFAVPAPDWIRLFTYWADLVTDRTLTAEDCLWIIGLPYYGKGQMTS